MREISIKTDTEKVEDQKGLDIMYQESLRHYLDRVQDMQDGLNQAYSLIYSTYCSKTMQGRIEALPTFDKKIKDDPIELLIAIKNCMVESVRAQYPLISMTESLTRLVNIKMLDNESALEYLKQFKQTHDVFVSHMGKDMLEYNVTQSEAYKKGRQHSASTS